MRTDSRVDKKTVDDGTIKMAEAGYMPDGLILLVKVCVVRSTQDRKEDAFRDTVVQDVISRTYAC